MLGGQGTPYLLPHEWQLSLAYRYQRSDRHFRGDKEERNRKAEGSEVVNEIHLFDFGLTYSLTHRFDLSLSLPFLVAERSQPIRDSERSIVGRNFTEAAGIGDVSILASGWLFDPVANPERNISIGLGVKFPTGEEDVEDHFRSADGTVRTRSVDQSIQPGDGGYGAILDIRAFTLLFDQLTLFGNGTYLFNPRNTNGVDTGRSRASESEISVADQYLARLGIAIPLVPEHGISFAMAGRVEGVPVRDLIGDSDGFRRPGIAVSIEPSLIYVNGPHTFAVSVPVAVYRNRLKSVSDRVDDRHGDAAFADYLILVSYSFRFGGEAEAACLDPTSGVPDALAGGGPFSWR